MLSSADIIVKAPWDDARVQALGPALITAANTAGIGLAVVLIEPPEPCVVYMTDVGAQIIGSPRERIVGQPAVAFLTPEEREIYRSRPDKVPAAATPDHRTLETTVLTIDGRRLPVEVSMARMELDGELIVVVFFRDISERHQSTEALRKSEERFRTLIELAPDAVWINDGRRLIYVNPGTVKMLGYDSAAEVMALDPLAIIHPEDHAPMIQRSMQMMASGQAMPPREYRIRRRDGSSGRTEVQSMPVEWEGQKAILGFARDVTARKEIEAQLVRSDRLAALGTLLAGIAHEMNNPLAYVLLGIDQIGEHLENLAANPTAIQSLREILGEVREGANRVAAVVKQLRATSRPDAHERGAVDLGLALQGALRMAGNEIRHRAQLVTRLEATPQVEGSAHRLEQVFLNLLVNAAQALPEGRAENQIKVSLRMAPGNLVEVEIEDNGNGIAPDVLPRIFDPFFTTKAVGVGMGLGLSICHGIVTAHGGTIDVDSEPGRGTRFCVRFPPRAEGTPSVVAVERSTPIPTAPLRRRRVLVVDDEPALGAMIERMLGAEFDVDVVTSGREAWARLTVDHGGGYHVILCDIMMPEMTGMDLHALSAKERPGMERRFVFMTGGAFTARATEFLAGVPNRRLEKPLDLNMLRAIVARR